MHKKKYKILIAFYSFTGHTEKLVKYLKEGAQTIPGVEVSVKRVPEILKHQFFLDHPQFIKQKNKMEKMYPEASLQDMLDADGVIIGTPVRFGSVASQVKQFIDGLSPIYVKNQMVNKPFAVFCSGGSLHGGEETALLSLMIPLIWLGMIPVGIPYPISGVTKDFDAGSPLGAVFISGIRGQNKTITAGDKKAAKVLGARLAMMTELINCNCEISKRALKNFREV